MRRGSRWSVCSWQCGRSVLDRKCACTCGNANPAYPVLHTPVELSKLRVFTQNANKFLWLSRPKTEYFEILDLISTFVTGLKNIPSEYTKISTFIPSLQTLAYFPSDLHSHISVQSSGLVQDVVGGSVVRPVVFEGGGTVVVVVVGLG